MVPPAEAAPAPVGAVGESLPSPTTTSAPPQPLQPQLVLGDRWTAVDAVGEAPLALVRPEPEDVDEPMHAAASDADDRWLADFFERKGLKEGLRQPPSLRSDSGGGLRQGSEGGREDLVKVLEEADKVKK